jgi:hypothetical protein
VNKREEAGVAKPKFSQTKISAHVLVFLGAEGLGAEIESYSRAIFSILLKKSRLRVGFGNS